MRVEVLPDARALALAAARFVAQAAREAVAARGRCVLAASGGTHPWEMFRAFAAEDVPWSNVHITQVDERVAPAGHAERNWTHLSASLARARLAVSQLHPMPVEDADLAAAADRYAQEMARIAGAASVLDIVHLGLGEDGHTASLVPGDPVLDISDRDVALCGVYQGRRRMTLTFAPINRARCLLWLVSGQRKAEALAKLLAADPGVPAGRVNQERAIVFADRAAAANF